MSSSSNHFRINNYDFGLNLTRQIAADQAGNVFFSPASITLVLAMCYFGAKGETKNEIKQSIFGSQSTDDDIKKWSKSVLQLAHRSNENFKLKFANRIYANRNYELKDKYVKFIAAFFHSAALIVNFNDESGRIVEEINNWVAQVTEQQITNLVSSGAVEPTTAMLLINALYFRGVWDDKFEESKTKKRPFEISTSETVQLDTMHLTETKGWYEDAEVQVLELEYGNSPSSMVLILPKRRHGLKSVLENLNGQKLAHWIDTISTREVIISIPKFKIEQKFELKYVLKNLGIVKPFSDSADFSDMATNSSLIISDVVHKSFIKVDEKGTEAAAATYVKVVPMSAQSPDPEPRKFNADHPFLFLILAGNHLDKNILFMGQFDSKDRTGGLAFANTQT